MAILLKAGQAVSRPAVVAILDWHASTRQVELDVDPLPDSQGASVASPKDGRLAVSHLLGPVVVVARPRDGSPRFEPGTTVAVRLRLRSPGGEEDELATERIDLSSGPGQPLLRISPGGAGTWEVRAEAVEVDLRLPEGVRDAYYAARRVGSPADGAVVGRSDGASVPLLAVDGSASMTRPLASGLVQDIIDVLAGVCARRLGAEVNVAVAVLGTEARLVPQAIRADLAGGFVADHLSTLDPASGVAIAPALALADRGGHSHVLVITDEPPPDVHHLAAALDADSGCHVTLILIGSSRWAAHPDDRPSGRDAWREQAVGLDPLVASGVLGVVAVPPEPRLSAERADALAERVAVELTASARPGREPA